MEQPTYIKESKPSSEFLITCLTILTCLEKGWFKLQVWEVTAVYPFRTVYSALNGTATTWEHASLSLEKKKHELVNLSMVMSIVNLPRHTGTVSWHNSSISIWQQPNSDVHYLETSGLDLLVISRSKHFFFSKQELFLQSHSESSCMRQAASRLEAAFAFTGQA